MVPESRSVRAVLRVQVQVRVQERASVSAPVPVPPQASEMTRTGWDSASVQVRVAEGRRALGWARRESTFEVERSGRLGVPPG